MSATKSIALYRQTVLIVCNALNLEAATFDNHAANTALAPQNRSVFEQTARDRRALSKELLEQWDEA